MTSYSNCSGGWEWNQRQEGTRRQPGAYTHKTVSAWSAFLFQVQLSLSRTPQILTLPGNLSCQKSPGFPLLQAIQQYWNLLLAFLNTLWPKVICTRPLLQHFHYISWMCYLNITANILWHTTATQQIWLLWFLTSGQSKCFHTLLIRKKKKVPKSKRIPWTLSQLANTVRHSPICSIEITLFVQLLLNIDLQFSPDLVSEYDNFVMIKLFTIISSHLRNVGYTIQQQQFNSIFSSSVLGTTRRSSYPTKNYWHQG